MACLIEQMAFSGGEEISLEAAGNEYEVEIYAILRNPLEIEERATSREVQEQWGVFVPKTAKNASEGTLRVRYTQIEGEDPSYVFCTKTAATEKGRPEVEDPVCPEQFQQLRKMAEQGLKKVRYNVPHLLESTQTNIVYQVDRFRTKDGEIVPWHKIDAEVAPGTRITAEDIPFDCEELIIVTPEAKANDPALKKKIGELYEKYFRSGNELVETQTA